MQNEVEWLLPLSSTSLRQSTYSSIALSSFLPCPARKHDQTLRLAGNHGSLASPWSEDGHFTPSRPSSWVSPSR